MAEKREEKNTITIEGREYDIPPLDVDPEALADEIDAHLAQSRFDPMEALARGADRLAAMKRHDLIETLTTVAFKALSQEKKPKLDPQEVVEWLATVDGVSWLFWRQLHQKHPDITHQQVRAELLRQKIEAARRKREDATTSAAPAQPVTTG